MAASSSGASGSLDVSYRPALDRLHAYEKAVCRIVQKGDDGRVTLCGTGFLIGPTLVMTCNHVVPDLETAKKCQAQFFKDPLYHPDRIERSPYTYDQLEFDTSDPDKFLFSPQNRDEKGDVREVIEGKLDYSILCLKEHPAFARRQYFQLFQSTIPRVGQITHLYQHPAETDSIDVSTGVAFKGAFAKGEGSVVLVKALEMHYVTPTEKGGSGGPVVDASGNLVALHYQGGIADYEGSEPHFPAHKCSRPSGHKSCNAGVRMDKILKSLDETAKTQIKAWIAEGEAFYESLATSLKTLAGKIFELPDPPSDFTGREKELEALEELCEAKGRVVVSGLGGVGKTATVLQYAHEQKEKYSFIHFIRCIPVPAQEEPSGAAASSSSAAASSESEKSYKASIEEGLLALARYLEIPGSNPKEQLANLKFHLNNKKKEFLLIFDGVDDPRALKEIKSYLPSRENGKCIVVTSRLASPIEGFASLDLRPFSPEDAVAYLLKTVNDPDTEQAALLAKELGYLPLALKHAAAYIQNAVTISTFKEYLELFKEEGVRLQDPKYMDLTIEEKTILTTWNISLNVIAENSDSSITLAGFLASLAPAPIPTIVIKQWFKTHIDPSTSEFERALGYLRAYSFVDASSDLCHIHTLVQQVIRLNFPEGYYESCLKEALRVFTSLTRGFDLEIPEDRKALTPFIPHCEGICSPLEKESLPNEEAPLVCLLLNKMWGFYQYGGKYQEALSYAQRDQKITEGQYGNPSPEWASSLNKVGFTLESLGKHEEALIYQKEALELTRELLGSKHPDVAMNLNNVGGTLESLGKHEEALIYHKEALELTRELLGSKHPHVALSLNNVGMALQTLGKHEEALVCLQEALELTRELLGSKHPHVALSLNNVGMALQTLGKHEEALTYLKEALELLRELLGSKHPHVALSLNNMGATLHALGKHEEALIYLKEALELRRELLGSKHPDVATSLNNVGLTLKALGKHEKALIYLKEALELARELHGSKHPHVAASLNNVGSALQALGKREKALVYKKEALELTRELHGSKHPDVARSLNNVGSALHALGKHEEALIYQKKALELLRELLGSKHPHVALSLNNVSSALHALGKHEEALIYQKKALELRRELLGFKHPDVANSLNNVGMALHVLGKYEEALVYQKEALELRRELLGSRHPDVAASLNNVGGALQALGKHEEALKHLQEAVEINEATLGPYHPSTCTFYRNLAGCLRELKRDEEAKVYQEKATMGMLSSQLPGNPISSPIASSSSSSQMDLTTKLAEITSEIEAFERDPLSATEEKHEALIQKIMELGSSGLDPRVLNALCERVFALPQNNSGASSSSARR